MKFRIGITIGDVVEREGDLLGDAVNIAARLEGLAEPGGICVSRTVYEEVSNKLSVRFADIGEQLVKNIPKPVHAYVVTTQETGTRLPTPKPNTRGKVSTLVATIALICAASLASAAYIYLTSSRTPSPGKMPPALTLSDPSKLKCANRTAGARMFATEPPRGTGALGFKEKAYVNDGQCPAGYIKEITGGSGRLGVPRNVQCVQC